jgi:hypothetical protein
MLSNFGIIITTYNGDFFLTKALLASIKKFMPTVPICIIQDGDFSLEKEKEIYNITHVIKKENVHDEFLRNNCFGSRCSNLVSFYESPFEMFLYLDSDIVLWGDILKDIDFESYDFIYNSPHEAYNDKIFNEQYFNKSNLFLYTESFDTENCNFFNSGIFISKKKVFNRVEFEELITLWKKDKMLLPTDPQSILNVLVFRNYKKNQLQVLETHLQTVVPVKSMQELQEAFQIVKGEPVVKQNTVIHWAGLKPFMTNKGKVFTLPEIYFRKEHLKNTKSLWRFLPTVYFYYEEFKVVLDRYHNGSILTYLRRKIIKK